MAVMAKHSGWKVWLLGALLGCASPLAPGQRDVRIEAGRAPGQAQGPPVTQIELQQTVLRFTGAFLDELVESCERLRRSENPVARREALRRVLVYSASVLDIATAPLPEVNVLDLVVFIRLNRHALERYWVPEVFGKEAQPLVATFVAAEERAWDLASKVLDEGQRAELNRLIEVWERAHPDQVRVEMVRFDEFSRRAGKVARELQENAEGLLSSAKQAIQAADQAMLLAERGVFLAHRLPFLMRLQARVGAEELITDSLGRLEDVDALVEQVAGGRQILTDVAHLLEASRIAAREARSTLEALTPMVSSLPPLEDLQATLASGNQLTDKALTLLRETRALAPDDPEQMLLLVEARAESLLRRMVWYFGLLGAALIFMFWGGYFAVRRLTSNTSK